jgi:hypothetical protein
MGSNQRHFFLKGIFFSLSLAVFSLLFPLSSVHAQDAGLRLITSPLPINLVTEPGKTIQTELKVKNGGTQTENLQISLMKFKAYEEGGKPQLMEREVTDDFLNWVSFSESAFTLAPDEWKTVTATFTVPETASFGYYYAFVFSRAEDPSQGEPRQTALVGGTAVLVLLEARVSDALREVTVAEFSADRQFYEFLPATFTVKLKNTGNVHIAPRGNIFIDQGSTKDITILEVNSEKGNILPESNRVFDAVWEDGFPRYVKKIQDGKVVLDEKNNPVTELKWDWNDASKLRFGKYTAKLLLIYDDGTHDVPIEGQLTFWVIPWRLMSALFVVLLFFAIGIRSTLQKIWKRLFGKAETL